MSPWYEHPPETEYATVEAAEAALRAAGYVTAPASWGPAFAKGYVRRTAERYEQAHVAGLVREDYHTSQTAPPYRAFVIERFSAPLDSGEGNFIDLILAETE